MNHNESRLRLFVILSIVFIANGKKSKKPTPKPEVEEEDFDADVFCKNMSRLIRLEKADEIYVVDSLVNNSVLLQCKYCEERDNGLPKTWSRQKHIFSGNITEVEPSLDNSTSFTSMFISKSHSLVVRHLQESHMGLYFCKAPYIDTAEKSFNYLIDLSLKSVEDVRGLASDLKNYTKFYIARLRNELSNQTFLMHNVPVRMKVFTEWADWSECDSCFRKEGIRYRIGRCRVKPFCQDSKECYKHRNLFKGFVFSDKQNTEQETQVEGEVTDEEVVKENIMDFGIALSCRSLLLLTLIPELFKITSVVPDFVLVDKCTAPCKGRVLRKGPRYRKSIILARGAHLTLVCPDSTIDSEVRWEHNKRRIYPNEGIDYIPGSIEPRLYVDSFNTLYLFEVTDKESGNFTCFVNGLRMQEVKILVLTRSLFFTKEFTRHLRYLGFVFLICFIAYLAGVIVVCVKSHREKKRNAGRSSPDSERLIKSDDEYESS